MQWDPMAWLAAITDFARHVVCEEYGPDRVILVNTKTGLAYEFTAKRAPGFDTRSKPPEKPDYVAALEKIRQISLIYATFHSGEITIAQAMNQAEEVYAK